MRLTYSRKPCVTHICHKALLNPILSFCCRDCLPLHVGGRIRPAALQRHDMINNIAWTLPSRSPGLKFPDIARSPFPMLHTLNSLCPIGRNKGLNPIRMTAST